MTYEVETPVFVGPFDLLLKMVTRRHVDVMEVNISRVIEDYLASIEEREVNLELASGFVLMAAMLIHLKARFLLPEPDQVDLEDEMELLDQRDRLLARLLGFLTYQGVATVLRERLTEGSRHVGRSAGIDQDLGTRQPPSLPDGVTPAALAEIMTSLNEEVRAEAEIPMDHFDLDLPSVEDAIAAIRQRVAAELESTFERLVAHCSNRAEVAAYFLAVLELARWGFVSVSQQDPDDISVRHSDAGPAGSRMGL
ncbi:MAG: segregation/condensation protein A [bacterium]|nr:segregation/condensation protein A [bacterium]MDE0352992.1 segregation/condensation protein A [bacterium]